MMENAIAMDVIVIAENVIIQILMIIMIQYVMNVKTVFILIQVIIDFAKNVKTLLK